MFESTRDEDRPFRGHAPSPTEVPQATTYSGARRPEMSKRLRTAGPNGIATVERRGLNLELLAKELGTTAARVHRFGVAGARPVKGERDPVQGSPFEMMPSATATFRASSRSTAQ
jgi:hypothetical protein